MKIVWDAPPIVARRTFDSCSVLPINLTCVSGSHPQKLPADTSMWLIVILSPQVEIGGGLWDEFQLLEVLGKGAFGTVRKIHNRRTGEYAAVKVFVKSRFVDTAENFMKSYQREIGIISHLQHVNPCRFLQWCSVPNYHLQDNIVAFHRDYEDPATLCTCHSRIT